LKRKSFVSKGRRYILILTFSSKQVIRVLKIDSNELEGICFIVRIKFQPNKEKYTYIYTYINIFIFTINPIFHFIEQFLLITGAENGCS